MVEKTAENSRNRLLDAGTELFRRQGYVATTVDEICQAAGVTKGAFFHHFESKELLAESCLGQWQQRMDSLFETAPFLSVEDPRERLFACIDYFIAMFSKPDMFKSCLAGTAAQEISETNPILRDAAQECFANGEAHFQKLLDGACQATQLKLDTTSLAELWMATLQGSILLAKASRQDALIAQNLRHFRRYIETLIDSIEQTGGENAKIAKVAKNDKKSTAD